VFTASLYRFSIFDSITRRCRSPRPLITSSLVCWSRVTVKQISSSVSFSNAPLIFASSPRLAGSNASANIGLGIGGIVNRPASDPSCTSDPIFNSSTFASVTMSPAAASPISLVSAPCIASGCPGRTGFLSSLMYNGVEDVSVPLNSRIDAYFMFDRGSKFTRNT